MFKFIKRLFSNFSRYFSIIFSKAKTYLKKEIPDAIEVVEQLKFFIDSPITPILNALIPGQVDDLVAAKVKGALPQILLDLKIAGECASLTSNDEIIQCAITHLRSYDPKAQHAYYLTIASMLSQALTDGKLSWSETIHLVEYAYQQKKSA